MYLDSFGNGSRRSLVCWFSSTTGKIHCDLSKEPFVYLPFTLMARVTLPQQCKISRSGYNVSTQLPSWFVLQALINMAAYVLVYWYIIDWHFQRARDILFYLDCKLLTSIRDECELDFGIFLQIWIENLQFCQVLFSKSNRKHVKIWFDNFIKKLYLEFFENWRMSKLSSLMPNAVHWINRAMRVVFSGKRLHLSFNK